MKHQPPKPQSNSYRAIQELRELIFSGELPAGSDHLESELAERLNMSRTPIREAALTLESQGLLELRQRKGVRVLPVSIDDMREIYDVLTELESLAARRAAEKGLDEGELSDLAAAITEMDHALSSESLDDWAMADDKFHQELVRLSGNSRIQMVTAMMNDQVRRARSVTLFIRPTPLRSNEDHRQVFNAIKSGDADKAANIHRQHRENAKNLLIGLLEKHRLNKV